ncbi:type II secretion system secretin GspD [Niveibacterium sp. 24ML]|uniref:type II secretion system secretin GspD n=1 Tax=Niveibacterium sp. 24ML TaxID=2985512 RepID=UPI00227140BB|nr:type II secretion system secretin GspD [Niveibacterium sp. 24ML]MCX9157585.1 type II secretion system secretin GspD [Niveibacterium sp. 24ML]
MHQPVFAQDGETVALNFVNADIDAVIRAVSKITGKNFLVDPRVKGTLNITTQQPVPKELTYQILLSALRMQGYTAVESKGVVKILPEVDAKLHAVPSGRQLNATGDRIVTQVFQIRHESAAQLIPVVRPLVSPNNTVTAYPGNNTLIVTDYAENIARVGQVLASIDVPQGDIRVIPVKHASALDMATTINRLVGDVAGAGAGQDASQRITVQADSRTNSLLVRSDNPSKLATVRQLVNTLDQPGAAGNIRVVFLKNAEAVKIAQTLRAIMSGDTSGGNAAAATAPQGGNAPGTQQTSATGTTASGGGMIQADPTTNTLIITAPEPVYNNLRKVIDQLDRRRAQVYVEALIAEMSSDNGAEFGVQWFAGEKPSADGRFVGGGTNFTGATPSLLGASTKTESLLGAGLNVLVGSGTVNIPGIGEILNLQVLARFLETQNKANILSTPTLLTLDNEEAKIVVAENLPFLTGQYSNTGGGSTPTNPFQTIERKDVGLTLKIKPQISEGGAIRLLISEENSTVKSNTAAGPTTKKRSIDTNVIVDDGAIVALGGLIQDESQDGADKVPFLGNIPVVGSLFRYDTRSRKKTNLVVFLRPKIVRSDSDTRAFTNERYEEILGLQRQPGTTRNYLMPDHGPEPQLPPMNAQAVKSVTGTPPADQQPAGTDAKP